MPLFTITISYGLLGTRVTLMTFLSLVPVIVGVCLTTLGDISFTRWGLILTLLGTFLAALKGVYTSLLQADPQRPRSHSLESQTPGLIEKGYSEDAMVSAPVTAKKSLDSLDLLYRMSPLALVQCVFYAIVTGELSDIRRNICLWDCPSQRFFASVGTPRDIIGPREIAILALNAVLAFALNYVSFTVNRKAGALGMTVAGTTYTCSFLLRKASTCKTCSKREAGARTYTGHRPIRFHSDPSQPPWHYSHACRRCLLCRGRVQTEELAEYESTSLRIECMADSSINKNVVKTCTSCRLSRKSSAPTHCH